MVDSQWICPICLDGNYQHSINTVPCNHRFHISCISQSINLLGAKCPYCRSDINPCLLNPDTINYSTRDHIRSFISWDDNSFKRWFKWVY